MTNDFPLVFRVIFESREKFRVMDSDQNTFPAEMAGRIRITSDWPTVGDWVNGTFQPGGWVQILGLHERKSAIVRKAPDGSDQVLAANVDTLFVVSSANQDLSLNRLDRYVAMAFGGGVRPVILVNKIELAENPHSLLDMLASRFPAVDIYGVSIFEKWNLECFENYCFTGQTIAFVGSSGVGKSSLTNFLLGSTSMDVSAIRESDGRGRHTTTHRELHMCPSGAAVIDTPGIRTVGLTDEADLSSAFSDVETLALACKFADCAHISEPGCAIRRALESGDLEEGHWQSYLKLSKELAYERRRKDKALQSEQKKHWAKIHRAIRKGGKGL